MAKKCGPGVICFENMTFALLFILVIMFLYDDGTWEYK